MKESIAVERWVLERLDRAEGMVRVERSPASDRNGAVLSAIFLVNIPLVPAMEDSGWWDFSLASHTEISRRQLLKELDIPPETTVTEGMVFYVFRASNGERAKVFNATPMARELAKFMYKRLLRDDLGDLVKGGSHAR